MTGRVRLRRGALVAGLTALVAAGLAPATASAGAPAGGTTRLDCGALAGSTVPAGRIGLPTSGARVTSAAVVPAAAATAAVPAAGTTPAVPAHPAVPEYCKVLVSIAPVDPTAPAINAQVSLPVVWNGKAMHFGGGGYDGSVPDTTANAPSTPAGTPTPLARGYATFGSDSGHQGGTAVFALNDEALVNFGYAALKKTHDVAVTLIRTGYGHRPRYTYFAGSSQGGREAITVAQRFPADYDAVLSRVPVVPFTELQIAGNRVGASVAAGGWMNAAEIGLLSTATTAACDGLDGVTDAFIADYADCRPDPGALLCPAGTDTCLSQAQVDTVRVVRSPLALDFPVANGVTGYPGWPAGAEAASWPLWVMGATPPSPQLPGTPDNPAGFAAGTSFLGSLGAQWIRYAIARDPALDTLTFDPNDPRWRQRIQQVTEIVDSTNPDLSAFRARGGKLIVQEHFGDYAQSGFAGSGWFESVVDTLGPRRTADFARLYVSPGADHGGAGAPSQVDWVRVLEDWAEHGQAPGRLVLTGAVGGVQRTLPACQFPQWPQYRRGPVEDAASYRCTGRELGQS